MWRTVLQKSKPAKQPETVVARARARGLWKTLMQRAPTAAAAAASAQSSSDFAQFGYGQGSEAMRENDDGSGLGTAPVDMADGAANPLFDAILNSHKRGGRRSVSKTLYDMVTRNSKLARTNTIRRPAAARRANR